jgi:hypothetical protein
MHRNNTTTHYLVEANGETFAEKCRDSLGGFTNMLRRLEARFGDRVRVLDVDAGLYAAGDTTFTLTAVNVL